MLTVIDDNPSVTDLLTRRFSDEMPDAVIVNVNVVEAPQDRRTGRKGLIVASLHAVAGSQVILTSFESEEDLAQDARFVDLVNRPNVTFLRLPAGFDEYRAAYRRLKQ